MVKNKEYYRGRSRIAIKTCLQKMEGKDMGIVIYPYGEIGEIFKNVLNEEFEIQERFIVDNYKTDNKFSIRKLESLSEEEKKNHIFVITSDNHEYYEEIRENIKKIIDDDLIVDMHNKVLGMADSRVESLRLNADRIKRYNIPGNVAELGVYKGDFARKINKYFPDRILYLFDTFEGFLHERVRSESEKHWLEATEIYECDFSNPEWENLLEKFPYPNMCVVKKGYFPETTKGIEEERFCYVSLDVDIYVPTKVGLEFFYPRMNRGGIIMIHDYNTWECTGVANAVDEFCKEHGIYPICLPDDSGSVIIIKQ